MLGNKRCVSGHVETKQLNSLSSLDINWNWSGHQPAIQCEHDMQLFVQRYNFLSETSGILSLCCAFLLLCLVSFLWFSFVTKRYTKKKNIRRTIYQPRFRLNIPVYLLLESMTSLKPSRRPESWQTCQPSQVGGCRQTL